MNKKKRNNKIRIVLAIVLLFFVVVFGVNSYFMGAVNSSATTKVDFSINKNETAEGVLTNLEKEGLIKSKTYAKIYVKLFNKANFKAGVFELSQSQNLRSIIETINSISNAKSVNVTFLEGYRVTDYARVAEENLGINKADFLRLCNDQAFINELKNNYEVIKRYNFNAKAIYQLEGLLAPDTYNVAHNTTAKALLEMLVAQTNKVYLENKALFDKSTLSLNEIYTLASIVEAEVSTNEDRVLVASIFMNRIREKMPLGSDATTYYGLQIDMASRELTSSELMEENGYNTRSNMIGLPVGPINSPSTQSIKAALNYYKTDYLYFVNDKNGKTYPSKTYQEHQKIIEKLKKDGLWFTHE